VVDKFFSQTLQELEGLVGPGVCLLCDREIAKSVKIRCMECPTPTVYCLDCLSHGRTKPDSQHLPTHAYYVYDNLDFPLLMRDWSARDELQLIQGLMKCGLGNWKDIAEQYVKGKSAEECEEHYYAFYNKSKVDTKPSEEDFIIVQRFNSTASSASSHRSSSQVEVWNFDEAK